MTLAINDTNQANGLSAELLFSSECIRRNLIVCYPIGDRAPYDIIVDNGNTTIKVQIKSTNNPRCEVRSRAHKGSSRFDCVKVYAIYWNNLWVIIPSYELKGKRYLRMSLEIVQKYANNWSLLNEQH